MNAKIRCQQCGTENYATDAVCLRCRAPADPVSPPDRHPAADTPGRVPVPPRSAMYFVVSAAVLLASVVVCWSGLSDLGGVLMAGTFSLRNGFQGPSLMLAGIGASGALVAVGLLRRHRWAWTFAVVLLATSLLLHLGGTLSGLAPRTFVIAHPIGSVIIHLLVLGYYLTVRDMFEPRMSSCLLAGSALACVPLLLGLMLCVGTASTIRSARAAAYLDERLCYSAGSGDVEQVRLLLAQGANPNAKLHGVPALLCAAMGGKAEAVQLLRSKGADPNGDLRSDTERLLRGAGWRP